MAHDFPPGKSGSSWKVIPVLFAKSISQMIPALSVCSEQYDDGAALFFNAWQESKIIETERPRLKSIGHVYQSILVKKRDVFCVENLIFVLKIN
ncbi:hypothetical protein LHK94_02705 [Dickeya zeae]|uniref:hypothetical protein n=1 Tax=Dickeya zeae TaxID=204042 RepID=UPI001CFAF40A|nr:hypothetical protein [Dickeya zeae]UCZ75944.1 hypothetical protein LHK94_02705 [Dickeya zeae]